MADIAASCARSLAHSRHRFMRPAASDFASAVGCYSISVPPVPRPRLMRPH